MLAGFLTAAVSLQDSELGTADCELVREGLVAQPAATATSVTFLALGAYLLHRSRRLPATDRLPAGTYATLMVLVGTGSVLYHGPQGRWAMLLHDVPIAALVVFSIVTPVSRLLRGRPALPGLARHSLALVAGLGAGALLAYVAGRTGSPWCRPESLVQPHALWHVLSAAALTAWAWVLWPGEGTNSQKPE